MATGARRALTIALLAFAYAATGRLGLALEPVAGFATLVWPPAGIALVALVRGGLGLWPGVALGALTVNLWVGASPGVALGIACGNTLAAIGAAEALRRASFDARLERVRDVLALAVFGAGLSTLVSASIGTLSLHLGGVVTRSAVATTWVAYWLGDAAGDLLAGAALACWLTPTAPPWAPASRRLEALLAVVLATGASVLVFGGELDSEDEGRTMYVLFPPLAWSAARLGPRGATASILAVASVAVVATLRGDGPFVHGDTARALLALQSFLAVVALVVLLLTAAIAERDRSRALALEAVRARDDFLAIAGHELKTPLSTLVLLLGTLRRRLGKTPEEPLREGVERIARQTDRLQALVGALFDIAALESGQLELRPETFDLAAMVREVLDRLMEPARKASSELRSTLPEHLTGSWDRLRLEQVVVNLVGNAFRHAPRAPVEVTLRAEGDHVELVVRDHGPGIPRERAARIFERFDRGGRRREGGGLGLGLHITRRIVEAHGGTIEVEPGPGDVGCRFLVRLPREAPGPERHGAATPRA